MKNPFALRPSDPVRSIGRLFGTPVVVVGRTWIPLIPLFTWFIMALRGKRDQPQRSWLERVAVAAVTTPVLLGSEWCHNIAHVAAARLIGRPMDGLRIAWGMPLCIYDDVNHADVTPEQHIRRAVGGPACNLALLAVGSMLRRFTRPGSAARELADVAVGTNVILGSAALLPIPALDGGSIAKWSLVQRGRSVEQAEEIVRRVDDLLAGALAGGSFIAARKRRWGIGGLLAVLAAGSFAFSRRWIEE